MFTCRWRQWWRITASGYLIKNIQPIYTYFALINRQNFSANNVILRPVVQHLSRAKRCAVFLKHPVVVMHACTTKVGAACVSCRRRGNEVIDRMSHPVGRSSIVQHLCSQAGGSTSIVDLVGSITCTSNAPILHCIANLPVHHAPISINHHWRSLHTLKVVCYTELRLFAHFESVHSPHSGGRRKTTIKARMNV